MTVDFMTQDASTLPYYAGMGYQAVELPYVGDETSMLGIMPDPGTFSTFEAAFDKTQLSQIISSLDVEPTLYLTMPKFNFRYNLSLKTILQGLA